MADRILHIIDGTEIRIYGADLLTHIDKRCSASAIGDHRQHGCRFIAVPFIINGKAADRTRVVMVLQNQRIPADAVKLLLRVEKA